MTANSEPITPEPSRMERVYKGPERRQHPRANAEMPITIGAKDRRFEARVRDISKSGICFSSPIHFPAMTVLRMDLQLPGKPAKNVRADGAVVRCVKSPTGDYSVAVFFTGITESEQSALADFVGTNLTRA